jgi:GntR family transcriptional regulator of arabinose operon
VEKTTVPNYQRIKQELMQDIARGNYAPDQIFITQQEACQRFQVSRITAERAINELVRDGILVRRRGQGTFVAQTPTPALPNQAPFSPAQKVIACMLSVSRSDYKTGIIRGVSDACREADCHLLFFDSNEKAEIEAANLQRALKAGVQGMIVYPVDGYRSADLFASLLEKKIPLVLIDRYYPGLPTDSVVPDQMDAGYQITRSLIEQGHRVIVTIWQETESTATLERLIGHKQALREAHLPIDAERTTLRTYTHLSGQERLDLLTRWLQSSTPPTALLTANSYLLGLVWRDLLTLGIEVGKDLILAAMDKDDPGVPLMAHLDGVILPAYDIGREAMRLLLNHFQSDEIPSRQIVLPVTLSRPVSVDLPSHLTEAS